MTSSWTTSLVTDWPTIAWLNGEKTEQEGHEAEYRPRDHLQPAAIMRSLRSEALNVQ